MSVSDCDLNRTQKGHKIFATKQEICMEISVYICICEYTYVCVFEFSVAQR